MTGRHSGGGRDERDVLQERWHTVKLYVKNAIAVTCCTVCASNSGNVTLKLKRSGWPSPLASTCLAWHGVAHRRALVAGSHQSWEWVAVGDRCKRLTLAVGTAKYPLSRSVTAGTVFHARKVGTWDVGVVMVR